MKTNLSSNFIAAIPFALALLNNSQSAFAADLTTRKFDFGPGEVAAGYTQVLPTNIYSREVGFGFEPGANVRGVDRGGRDALRQDFCTGDGPFYFSVALPEGNYKVRVTLGDMKTGSTNTIKAELRRLMIEKAESTAGSFVTKVFVVNVRTPRFPSGEVKLKDRERTSEIWAWDEKLTLEFNGSRPCVCAVEIEPADNLPTVFLLGDSTVCDQPKEPWNSWGQMLPRFFKPTVAIANHAQSGETLKSSMGAKRLDKVLSAMKAGDYLFIQFGHNDMKDKATNAVAIYKENLKRYVAGARSKGGTPVLITSMERKGGVDRDTLQAYPDTVREVAREEKVMLIDLHATSRILYKALGADLGKAFQDGTHHNNYGSYELAKCIAQAIKESQLPLAREIAGDFVGFDPGQPDSVASFAIPTSPGSSVEKPLGD
ncbi:MAG: rhamnogalacturonan acetylesterase [Akkermansiaceae bacterium]|nr:rhamnogalacturonan acetylesterase [Verrucomicrobiales bacterium]